jgi:DNA-binding NarL/FixJ family response regulator
MDEREQNEFKALGVRAMLEKPFTQEKLAAALKTALQGVNTLPAIRKAPAP